MFNLENLFELVQDEYRINTTPWSLKYTELERQKMFNQRIFGNLKWKKVVNNRNKNLIRKQRVLTLKQILLRNNSHLSTGFSRFKYLNVYKQKVITFLRQTFKNSSQSRFCAFEKNAFEILFIVCFLDEAYFYF